MTQRRAVYSRFPFIYAPEEAFREIYRQARRIFAKLAGQVINRVELLSTASSLLSNSFNRIVSRHICFFISANFFLSDLALYFYRWHFFGVLALFHLTY